MAVGSLPSAFGKTWRQAQNSWLLLKQFLEDDIKPVSKLPTTDLFVGRTILFYADEANGVVWQLFYDGKGELPWKKVGGPPLFAEVITQEGTASTVYVNLATIGPWIITPLKGIYMVSLGALLWNSAAGGESYMAVAISEGIYARNNDQAPTSVSRTGRLELVAAGVTVAAKYRTSAAGTLQSQYRWMTLDPLRVG